MSDRRIMSEIEQQKMALIRALAKLTPSRRAEIVKDALEKRGLRSGQRTVIYASSIACSNR